MMMMMIYGWIVKEPIGDDGRRDYSVRDGNHHDEPKKANHGGDINCPNTADLLYLLLLSDYLRIAPLIIVQFPYFGKQLNRRRTVLPHF